tara:strand:- start:1154 stop:1540 length:387 start_codon:yes stop_codon:yes gene_type:complete
MKIYSTICCKEKKIDKELLESINRYISARIYSIYKKSQKDQVEFRILSGKFGLLKPEDKIPFYDKKLNLQEIEILKEIVKKQLISQKIEEVIFFSENPKENPDWKPYINLIKIACLETEVILTTKIID